ncbi:hypothetical protein GCM10007938_12570 [Vibrio zhanjiangensis]|uniref:Tetratricopeptide repeat protein n=1 Tax=Vibrio zhanjiangensis TaxID=1046128 RepID=A0ABQ6EY80_9VIBR|nr:tetratricopeptide repeat protein [Vibrio zhanjiangensis]GLT17480.1 hypothetical protein GCM10007938_12570 [Vibrio zhanjiangensis]
MKNQAINFGKPGDEFFSLLDGDEILKEIAQQRDSNKITTTHLKSIFDLGVEFYNQFQFKEAEIVFVAYSSLNPYDHRGPGCLAAIYLEKGQFQKALDMLNLLKNYPTNDLNETMLNISLCHYKLNDHMQAAVHWLIVKPENLGEFYTKRYEFLKQQLSPHLS